MKSQYNFKIEEEFKQELDLLQSESGVDGKEEFLQELLSGYKHCKANQVDTDIDLSKYETVSKQTKTILSDAFKHILATIESNSTNTKQQALTLEQDRLSIVDERKSFIEQLDQLTANHNQKLLDIDKLNKEQLSLKDEDLQKVNLNIQNIQESKDILDTKLSDLGKELLQVQTIAEQVQIITNENKELRSEQTQLTDTHNQKLLDVDKLNKEQLSLKDEEIKKLTDLFQKNKNVSEITIKELEQNSFKNELVSSNKDKELELLKKQLLEVTKKDETIKELEKQNTILSTKLEMYSKAK